MSGVQSQATTFPYTAIVGAFVVGDVLYADSTQSLARLADVATGNALISGGVGTAPSWGKIGLTTHVSGTLPVANGGTGATSLDDIVGTANQITVDGGAGTVIGGNVTLSLPQDIDTAAAPTFAGLTLTNSAVDTALSFQGVGATFTKTAGASDFSDSFQGLVASVEIDQSGGEVGNTFGLNGTAILTDGTIGNAVSGARNLVGLNGTARVDGGTVTGSVRALVGSADSNAGTVAGDLIGVFATVDADGTVTGEAIGFYFDERSNVDWAILHEGGTAPSSLAGSLLIGTQTIPSGATKNLVLGGGSTSPVLGAATADMVAMAAIDNGAGNRELQVQPEAGGILAFGNNKLRRVRSSTQDVEQFTATVNTTDATVTTLTTIAISASYTYLIDAIVVARRTGGASGTADDGASYHRRATYTTKAGTVTLMGSVQTIGTDAEDQAGWDVTLDISTTNVRARVTGAASNNITWSGDITVRRVSS